MATDNTERTQVGPGFWLWWMLASAVGFGRGKSSTYLPFGRWIERWRIKLSVQKPRDPLRGVGGWTKRPEQLHGGLHQLDLRDVFPAIEPQEADDVFVRDRSFHWTYSLVPECPLRHNMNP